MNNKTLRRIFFCWNGKKVSIRLGRMNDNNFNYSKAMILDLIQDLSLGFSVRENVKNWLKNIPPKIYKKLAKIGLVPNQKQSVSLGEVIQIFLEAKKSIKQKTKISYEVCLKRFLKIFKSCKEISTFNEGDVDFFVENLTSRWPNASTRSKTISVVKQLFRFAHRKKIICEDCFQELKRGPMVNSSRCTYIPRHVIDSLLESIPKYHEDLRTTIILARFAGLRSPSEVVNLRWGDIDWDNNLICLQISKTAIHGHYSRVIPIFSDLKPYLEEMKKKI